MICNAMVALAKKGNLEWHFKTVHRGCERDFPAKTPLRITKVQDSKAELAAQSVFTKLNTQGRATTIASYCISLVLAKHKKTFKDGNIV